ncbi:MAG: transcriptional activator domain protein, partial [Chthonomonadales bacterium]|nr:transcriptional activator domain protein [Chthonomonadales bacterium]
MACRKAVTTTAERIMEHERDWMVRILGPITVEYRGQDTGNKLALHSRALLVYLAGTAMIGAPPLERNTLQELLWPDPNRGQDPVTLLRVRLSQLRKAFQHGETSPDDILFCAGDTRTVELILSTVEIDAQRFQQLFAKSTHASAELERAKLLREATTLYRGDFGGTWPFDSGLSTDAHLLRVQASLKLTYYDALYQLVKLGVALNDHEQARRDFQTLQTLWVSIENDPQLFDTSADRMEELSEIFSDVEHQPTAASGRTSEPAERLMPKRHLPSAHHQRAAAPDTPRNRRQEQSPADQQSRDDSAPVPISATSLVGHDLTPFIGRAAELDRLLTDFERPFRSRASYWGVTNRRARLITLYGLTGAGKTRIAKEIIHRLSSEASLITRFISLADVSDTEQLLPRIAAALGLNQGGEVFLQVAYKLQAASYLLVLDSLERLMPACNQTIVHLLEQCPSLLCLVTSQRMMGIPQENAIPLHPMAVPQLGEPLEQVVRYDSIRLFVERARARESTFEITKDNVDSIVRLVQSLSGLPLAIKIAAMRINVRTPAEMLKQVQRIEWLTLTTPAEDPRHASLLGAFQWTYDLLPPKLRSCFLALAYFRGGWTPKAAAAIWRVSEVEADRHTEGLLQFALVIKADIQETSIRYTMPDALRLFTESVERHADALESIAERHSAYYQTFVRSQILGGPSPSSRQQIDVEHENIMRVLAYLAQNPADLEAEVQFGITLFDYWNHCNHWGEWRRWMERVLPQRAGLSNPTRRSLLCGAGVLERLHSNYDAAISYYEEAADIPSDN